ncbi:MAG: major outer membrane protein [Arcobacteraceae bacterium]|jgi:hypothetical protein|nr:major outer membrane protein [Arcobacteraceae bacterium]
MKKFAKISLAAAVAVAGLSSVASAKPLEEAIKGVDATGYVTYQYNDTNSNLTNGTSSQNNTYKAALSLTIPAADDVAVKVTGVTGTGLNASDNAATTDGTGDVNPTTNVEHANFVYTGVQNLTVIAGKQALNTPWTEGTSVINSTQNGTGALALYNAGFATIAAGHFVNNGIDGASNGAFQSTVATAIGVPNSAINIKSNDITVAAAIVPMGEIATAQVWYARIGKTSETSVFQDGAKALSAVVDVNLMDVAKLNVRHSTLKDDVTLVQTNKMTKAVLSGAVGPVNLAVGYGKTGTNGGLVAFDKDTDATMTGYQLSLNGIPDAKAYLLSANMNVMPSVNVALTHINGESDNSATGLDLDFEETYAQVTYNHNKNLSAYVRYGSAEIKDGTTGAKAFDTDAGRLQVGYKF